MTAFAIALVRWWTRVYTCGLPPAIRDARRDEIESDLWESVNDSEVDAQILWRLVFGIVDDLRWRAGLLDDHARSVAIWSAVGVLACIAFWQFTGAMADRSYESRIGRIRSSIPCTSSASRCSSGSR